jgi:hypothetical protein
VATKKISKNNPSARVKEPKMKMVTSTECENCKEKCSRGIQYLKVFNIKKQGNGVPCRK